MVNVGNRTSWVVRPRPNRTAALRLVCCPYAGVGASAFARWVDRLPARIELCCIQPPGRESRLAEPPLGSVLDLAHGVATAVEPLLDRPYALFGHSLGAMVAFEAARALRARACQPPSWLFVSASRAPREPWPHPPLRYLDDVTLAHEIGHRYGGSIPAPVIESAELRSIFMPSLRADLAAIETYTYQPAARLECPVSAFAGLDDRMAPPFAVDSWRHVTSGPFRLRAVEGGHFFVKSAAHGVLAALTEDLLSDGCVVQSTHATNLRD